MTVRHSLKKARAAVFPEPPSDKQVAQGGNVLPDTDTEDADAQGMAPGGSKGKKKGAAAC